jgi:putative transcriptional regulator
LRTSIKRWLFLAVALALPATILHAARPTAPDAVGPTSLAGQLLIASPELRQPEFDHAVILLAKHTREGALGIVINRPGKMHPIADLLTAFGVDAAGVHGDIQIFLGGPVDPGIGFVVHSAEYQTPDTLDIDARVALTIAPEVLRDIGLDKGPRKSLVAFGYAGWAPSQLDNELAHGVWITLPEDPALVFDDDRAKLWDDARARQKTGTVNLAQCTAAASSVAFSSVVASAQSRHSKVHNSGSAPMPGMARAKRMGLPHFGQIGVIFTLCALFVRPALR